MGARGGTFSTCGPLVGAFVLRSLTRAVLKQNHDRTKGVEQLKPLTDGQRIRRYTDTLHNCRVSLEVCSCHQRG